MPKPWAQVEGSSQYQSLSPDDRQKAKQQYFDSVVAPQVGKSDLDEAKSQFFGATSEGGTAESDARKIAESRPDWQRSMTQGMTFGLGDEMTAGLGAGLTAVGNTVDRAFGKTPKYTAGEFYDATLDQERAAQSKHEDAHPFMSFAEEMLGGAINPVSGAGGKFIGGAPGVIGKAARGAMVGGGFGAASGFASGQGSDFLQGTYNRLKDAVMGAGVGMGMGVLPPVAMAGGKTAGKMFAQAGKAFRSVFTELSGKTPEEAIKVMSPQELQKWQDSAIEYVKGLISSSGKKVSDLSQDETHKMGKPITGAEAIGRVGSNQLASLGRRSGETGDIAETQFRQRAEGRPDRIMQNLAQESGLKPEHVQGNMEDLSEKLREANQPLYEKAEAHPPVNVSEDKELMHLFSQPNMQQALRWAKRLAENEGRPWSFSTAHQMLSWKDLDYVKRGLQTVINRTHKNPLGKMITDDASRADLATLDKFRKHLFKLNPDYETAVQHAGEPIRLEKAYADAPKFMSGNVTERQFDKKINDLSPAEASAFKSGWVNDIYTKLQSGRLKLKDIQEPVFLAKAQRLLGVDKAKRFVSSIQQEMRLKANEERIPPGRQSITGELKHAGEEMDAKTDEFIEDITDKVIRRGARGVALAVNRALWNVFRAAKTPEREVLRNEVGKLLLLKPDQLQQRLEQHGKVAPSTKAKEIMRMLSHVGYGTSGPLSETAAERVSQ